MTEKIPKLIRVQDSLEASDSFLYATSVDQREVAFRKNQSRTGVNIAEDQVDGMAIAIETLAAQTEIDDQAAISQLLGGAAINTGMFILRGLPARDPRPMSRLFRMPVLTDHYGRMHFAGVRRQDYISAQQEDILRQLESTYDDSRGYADELRSRGKVNAKFTDHLGRSFARSGLLLSVYDTELYGNDEATNARISYDAGNNMLSNLRRVTREIGANPSIAQLKDISDPKGIGAYIIKGPFSLNVKSAYKTAQEEIVRGQGY